MKIGDYNTLTVIKKIKGSIYLKETKEDIKMIHLPKKQVPSGLKEGDTIDVFVYPVSGGILKATLETPYAKINEYAYLEVTDVTDFGAFLDWGIEKDLMVPLKEQTSPMKKGNKYIIRICEDQKVTGLIGSGKFKSWLVSASDDLKDGMEVDIIVIGFTDIGVRVIASDLYNGLIYNTELFEDLKIGDKKTGYIKKIREDGKLDISLRKQGYTGIIDSEERILKELQVSEGFLPFSDKSDPADIKRRFNMSKKSFKQAIGSLYKKRKIQIEKIGIKLI